jgi:O-antigen ligase
VTAELARVGGALGCAGLAVLLLARPRWARLAGLGAWAAGGALLLLHLAPDWPPALLAGAVVAGIVGAVLLALLFVRWPWLVPVAALAAAPVRLPVELGDEQVSLLLPLYGVVAGSGVALGWRLARGDGRSRELGPLAWPLAALVAWLGASLLWTADLRQGAVTVFAFLLPFTVLAVVVARLPWDRRWLTALGVQLGVMAVLIAAVGGYQWLTRDVFWNPKVIVGNAYAPFYRVNSVFWDPSIYGRFLVLAIVAVLVVCLFARDVRVALAAAVGAVALWMGLLLSFSQSSFVALIAAALAAAALAWGRRALLALGIVAVLLLSVGFTAPELRHALVSDTADGLNRATSGRSSLLANGVGIAASNPASGVGLGSFKRAYADRTGLEGRDPQRGASHTTPVTVAAEAGLPGLVLFLWLVGVALVTPLRRVSRDRLGVASVIVGLALLAIVVHSLFYAAFFEDPLTWLLLGLVGLLAAWRGEPAEEATA